MFYFKSFAYLDLSNGFDAVEGEESEKGELKKSETRITI